MKILDELDEIKKSLESEQKRKMRFEGKLEAKMESLTELKCPTVAKAKQHILHLEEVLDESIMKLDELIKDFQTNYPKFFGDKP